MEGDIIDKKDYSEVKMGIPILLLLSALASLGARTFSKLCSNIIVGYSKARYMLFYAVNGIVSCIFFLIADGFRVELNFPTFIFSLIFALLVAASLFISLWMLKLATISGVNILGGAFGLVLSSAMGFIAFSEEVEPIKLVRIALMLLAAFFVFLDEGRQKKDSDGKKNSPKSMLPLLLAVTLSAIVSCLVTLTTKLYIEQDTVASENSFFFWSNVLLVIGAALLFTFECLKNKRSFFDAVSLLRPKKLISLAGNTLCSNVGTLIAIWLVAQMDLSVYTPVSSAIGVIVAVLASLLFREKLGLFSYLAAAVACVAVII